MDYRPKLPHYDPDYCQRVARWAASICVGILIVEPIVLLFAVPFTSECRQNTGAMLFWFLIFTAMPAGWICYVALRWEQKFSQEMYDSITYNRSRVPFWGYFSKKSKSDPQDLNYQMIFLLDSNQLFLRVSIWWCLICAMPLFVMLTSCTAFLQRLDSWAASVWTFVH